MNLVRLSGTGWCDCCSEDPGADPHRCLALQALSALSGRAVASEKSLRSMRGLQRSVAIQSWEVHAFWPATRHDLLRPHGLLPLGNGAGAIPRGAFRDASGHLFCDPPLPVHTGRPLLFVILPERNGACVPADNAEMEAAAGGEEAAEEEEEAELNPEVNKDFPPR